jgi:hypothetical protein
MKAFINSNFAEQACAFEPILFAWSQDWMVASKPFDKYSLGRLRGSPAKSREHHS